MSSSSERGDAEPAMGASDRDRSSRHESVLAIRAGSLWLGIPAHKVEQLHAPTQTTPMPLAPEHIPGLAVFRGEVVPLLDVERFLGLGGPEGEGDPLAAGSRLRTSSFERVAVVSVDGMQVGLMCREVGGIQSVELPESPGLVAVRGRRLERVATCEVSTKDGLLVVIDVGKLLEEARVKP